jgi:hypothetical protein
LRLSLFQSQHATAHGRCRALKHPVTRTLEAGQAVRIGGGPLRISAPKDPRISVRYFPYDGRTLTAVHGPLTVRMASESAYLNPDSRPAALCE